MQIESCPFCNAKKNSGDIGKTLEFKKNLSNLLPSRTLFKTNDFSIIVSIGAIVEGYLLILLNKHFLSTAYLTDKLLLKLQDLEELTRKLIQREYTTPLFFEHGEIQNCNVPKKNKSSGGSSVQHAHLHAVPVSQEIEVPLIEKLKERFDFRKISSLLELKNQLSRKNYLYFCSRKGERYVFEPDNPIPSQYIRSELANFMNLSEKWDWKINPMLNNVVNTVHRLKKRVDENGFTN